MGSFRISEGNITGRTKKKKNPTDYTPNFKQRNTPDAHICQQRAGAEQGGVGCMLRVRTGPECPEGNLRVLP